MVQTALLFEFNANHENFVCHFLKFEGSPALVFPFVQAFCSGDSALKTEVDSVLSLMLASLAAIKQSPLSFSILFEISFSRLLFSPS